MQNISRTYQTIAILMTLTLGACGSETTLEEATDDIAETPVVDDTPTSPCANPATELSSAFLEFVSAPNVTAVLAADGCSVTFESDGKPDHTSSYWDEGNASGLYVAPENAELFDRRRSPGDIEDYSNIFELTVPIEPALANVSSATPLGAIGIAISGTPIFNDSEGNGDVSSGVIDGFDRNGAHTGPQTYHYHLEPKAISFDDDKLVGIMSDGFLIFGRRCFSTVDYPTDLDESNGHVSNTLYTGSSAEDAEYHYHISNEQYLNAENYLIFPGNFQGTPNGVN
jgi:hypothetical protein